MKDKEIKDAVEYFEDVKKGVIRTGVDERRLSMAMLPIATAYLTIEGLPEKKEPSYNFNKFHFDTGFNKCLDQCRAVIARDYVKRSDICEYYDAEEMDAYHSQEIAKKDKEIKLWKDKYNTLNKELMAELRDPAGTIWEHAKKQQEEISELVGLLKESLDDMVSLRERRIFWSCSHIRKR